MTRYALPILTWLTSGSCASELPGTDGSLSVASRSFEYPTVAAALSALRARTNLVIREENGWLGFQDDVTMTIWTFTPRNHLAYPSVVKQTIVQKGDDVVLELTGLCEATKIECEKLMAEYRANVERIRSSVRQ